MNKSLSSQDELLRLIAKKTFELYDEDGNGTLDLEEVAEFLQTICACLGMEKLEGEQREQIFKLIDENGDGVIEYGEIIAFLPKITRILKDQGLEICKNDACSEEIEDDSANPFFISGLKVQLQIFDKIREIEKVTKKRREEERQKKLLDEIKRQEVSQLFI
jgi:hypothetical protein